MKSMNPKLNELEVSALLAANETGQIDFPCGSAMEIEDYLHALLRLEKLGFVSRSPGKAFYRPFTLTATGHSKKAELILIRQP